MFNIFDLRQTLIVFFILLASVLLIFGLYIDYQNDKINVLRKEIQKNERELSSLMEKNGNLHSIIERKNAIIKSQKKEIKDITKKLDLIITFKDAGLDSHSVEDIRELVDIAGKVPYGSPFSSGHYFTSYYGKRNEKNFGGSPHGHHKGVDIRPNKRNDTIVKATADGEITDFGVSDTLGKYIVFETDGGYRLKYGHLNTIYWQDVSKQQVKNVPVEKGDKLGIMGNTGSWSTGPHLHLEIYYYDQKKETYIELNPRRIIEYIGGKKKEDI